MLSRHPVTFSTAARRDLQQIGDQIAESRGRRAARIWVERLQRRTDDLIRYPEAGQIDPDLGERRRLVEAPFLIFYRVLESDEIVILPVLDGRRDLQAIFADDARL